MSYEIKVRRTMNGFVLSWSDECADDTTKTFVQEEVVEDDDQDELKSGEEMLWKLIEYFGLSGSKHDKERLRITREKQCDDKPAKRNRRVSKEI